MSGPAPANPVVSVILPTYDEVDNIKTIVPAIHRELARAGIAGEIIVVDDDSPDGTAAAAADLAAAYPVRVVLRTAQRGLATAVLEGFRRARGSVVVVMDADLSHPVEKLPEMILPILGGQCDITVGSRCVAGGGRGDSPHLRRAISRAAGGVAKGLTRLSDPTTGFMAIRSDLLTGVALDPVGWKIVLEVVVKVRARLREVPIIFSDRVAGESKLDWAVPLGYVRHLARLYRHRYPQLAEFLSFALVGLSGAMVDASAFLLLLQRLGLELRLAAVGAFTAAVTWNFLWNRAWTFRASGSAVGLRPYVRFVAACFPGFALRIALLHLLVESAGFRHTGAYLAAGLIGIASAALPNFIFAKFYAFAGAGGGAPVEASLPAARAIARLDEARHGEAVEITG